jgi:hypothetical protein
MKKVYFSNFIDEGKIKMQPQSLNETDHDGILHRFSLTIPFREKREGGHAIVIMKNPSNAGKKDENGLRISDDTIYKVLDYLYKQTKYKVTILNLFTMVNGTPAYLKEYIGTPEELRFRKLNDDIFKSVISNFNMNKDIIIAGWGDYKPLLESAYKQRIREVLTLIDNKPIYRVGPMVNKNKYPGHGKLWYDYEELLLYPPNAVR